MASQPIQKGRILIRRLFFKLPQGQRDAQFLGKSQVMCPQETSGEMQRRRERIAAETADPAIGRHEIERPLRFEQAADADPFAKVGQVGAAAHTHMLTCVDELTGGGILKGAGTAAKPAARFQNLHLKSTRASASAAARPANPPPTIRTRSAMLTLSRGAKGSSQSESELPA